MYHCHCCCLSTREQFHWSALKVSYYKRTLIQTMFRRIQTLVKLSIILRWKLSKCNCLAAVLNLLQFELLYSAIFMKMVLKSCWVLVFSGDSCLRTVKKVNIAMWCIADDHVLIENGTFSWSDNDPSVLKEYVFLDFFHDCRIAMCCLHV